MIAPDPDSLPLLDETVLARLRQVGGDDLVAQIVGFFLRTTPQRLQILHEGARTGDAQACESAAHALQSSAGNVGARQVQQRASRIERDAEQGLTAELGVAVQDLTTAWEQVQVVLRAHTAPKAPVAGPPDVAGEVP